MNRNPLVTLLMAIGIAPGVHVNVPRRPAARPRPFNDRSKAWPAIPF